MKREFTRKSITALQTQAREHEESAHRASADGKTDVYRERLGAALACLRAAHKHEDVAAWKTRLEADMARIAARLGVGAMPPPHPPHAANYPSQQPGAGEGQGQGQGQGTEAPVHGVVETTTQVMGKMTEKPTVQMDELAGMNELKQHIMDVFVDPLEFPTMHSGIDPVRGMLLYGPAGTGKTKLARAVACKLGWAFISAKPSDIFDRYVGESEKAMRRVFEEAAASAPCLVFLDEVDAILGSAQDSESGGQVRGNVIKEFLIQANALGNVAKPVIIIGATNSPWTLEANVRRRLGAAIYVPLPDATGRCELFTLLLRGKHHSLSADDLAAVSAATDGHSGADLERVVADALMAPVRRFKTSTHFLESPDGTFTPAAPSDPSAVAREWRTIPEASMRPGPVTLADLCASARLIRPTNTRASLARYAAFTAELGTHFASPAPPPTPLPTRPPTPPPTPPPTSPAPTAGDAPASPAGGVGDAPASPTEIKQEDESGSV